MLFGKIVVKLAFGIIAFIIDNIVQKLFNWG